ncbi:hypothetical protein CEXT_129771 [Caerostris extrusa]|uniref:Uncharacterized protein n=1 Tax=Caerostris extrusa TaxID=172846 RepID=A0AAV4P0N9_CAEEX|nr:hypothetical protein CEXT_129771 [Caerostris extrusa]
MAAHCPCPYSIACNEMKWKINDAIKNYYVTQATEKHHVLLLANFVPDNLPKHMTIANFRLMISYGYLQGNLYRIVILPSPDCPL